MHCLNELTYRSEFHSIVSPLKYPKTVYLEYTVQCVVDTESFGKNTSPCFKVVFFSCITLFNS